MICRLNGQLQSWISIKHTCEIFLATSVFLSGIVFFSFQAGKTSQTFFSVSCFETHRRWIFDTILNFSFKFFLFCTHFFFGSRDDLSPIESGFELNRNVFLSDAENPKCVRPDAWRWRASERPSLPVRKKTRQLNRFCFGAPHPIFMFHLKSFFILPVLSLLFLRSLFSDKLLLFVLFRFKRVI